MTYAHATAAPLVPGPSHSTAAGGRRRLDPAGLGQYADRLYRAAWFMCGSPDEAEDLVQDTFARVLSKPRFLHSDDDLGYLLRVLRNTALTARRTAARRPMTVSMADESPWLEDHSAARPETSLALLELFEAIATLPDMFKETLIAVDVVGLSYREAALALGVREATLTTRLHRARQRLARSLDM
jgi:RNA polymerase sigma-70 factor (ECF subfamily)